MTELFTNLTSIEKNTTQYFINLIFSYNYRPQDIPKVIKTVENYRKDCRPEVQEYIDFCFQMKLEELKHESNND